MRKKNLHPFSMANALVKVFWEKYYPDKGGRGDFCQKPVGPDLVQRANGSILLAIN